MNTRMTILLPRRDAPSAPADSGLARTRRQNSAENRGCHRVQRSLRVRSRRSGSLPPGPQLKAQRLPAAGRGRGGEDRGRRELGAGHDGSCSFGVSLEWLVA